jgi:hypothetical protein
MGRSEAASGLERPGEVINQVADSGADAIITTYGIARAFGVELARLGLIMRTDRRLQLDPMSGQRLFTVGCDCAWAPMRRRHTLGPGHANRKSRQISGCPAWPATAIAGVILVAGWCRQLRQPAGSLENHQLAAFQLGYAVDILKPVLRSLQAGLAILLHRSSCPEARMSEATDHQVRMVATGRSSRHRAQCRERPDPGRR